MQARKFGAALVDAFRLKPAAGLREAFRAGYGAGDLKADVLAGVVVALVALPLAMALSIAAGAPPQHGLFTAIVAGAVAGVLASSRAQIVGPTNNFVILAPIAAAHGLGGLACASMMAGVLLLLFALARLGRLIQYIPFTVTQGFTSAIGVVIGVLQLKDFLGLPIAKLPEGFLAQAATIGARIGEARVEDFSIGLATFVTLVFWPRVTKRVPAPLVALVLGAALAEAARRWAPGFSVATVGSRFANAVSPPSFALPWTLPGAHGETFAFDFDAVRRLLPSAFAIALLVSIESLLSAVVADALMGTNHDPDAELMAQGTGNFAAAFFGGFGATGALARTATNVRAGARSPVSAVVHAAVLLAVSAWAAPWIAYLPMASLAALLMMTAWNLADVRYFARLLRQSPSHDVVVLMTCFVLTLVFDMEVGVTAGVTLASLLFMRRMSESVGFRTAAPSPASQEAPPPGVVFYEVAGPFFFGAAAKLVSRLKDVLGSARCLVLDVGAVPFIDATGLVNLRSVVDRLRVRRTPILLARVQPEVARALRRAGLEPEPGVFELHDDPQSAAASARAIAAGDVPWGRTPAPPRGA